MFMFPNFGLWVLLLPYIAFALPEIVGPSTACTKSCHELSNVLPAGSVTILQPFNFYWAQQQSEVKAACYASPSSALEVSKVLLTAKKYQCRLAIRGGGHSDVPGASNIQDGIVLNLGQMKQITVDQSQQVARIGAGCSWGDVYKKLDPLNVTTAGGREESVGVAGLLLGGGFSYFSGTRGFACDNIKSLEAVLADGSIVEISNDSTYSDLYKALKGGGNNFAVVTRFDLDMFSYNKMSGGLILYSDSPQTGDAVTQAFTDFARDAPSAPNANLFVSISYLNGIFLWSAGPSYTLPELKPAIFSAFSDPKLTSKQLLDTRRVTTHGDLAAELDKSQPSGFRNQFTTATFANDLKLQRRMVEIFREEAQNASLKIIGKLGFIPGLSFQPVTKNLLSHQSRRGGNVLGIEDNEAPLMIVGFLWQWSSSLDDKVVKQGIQNVLDRSRAVADEMGLLNEFIYQNYAAPNQDPLGTYGTQNRDFMRQVSKKYDADGIFQKLVAGGFKLS